MQFKNALDKLIKCLNGMTGFRILRRHTYVIICFCCTFRGVVQYWWPFEDRSQVCHEEKWRKRNRLIRMQSWGVPRRSAGPGSSCWARRWQEASGGFKDVTLLVKSRLLTLEWLQIVKLRVILCVCAWNVEGGKAGFRSGTRGWINKHWKKTPPPLGFWQLIVAPEATAVRSNKV